MLVTKKLVCSLLIIAGTLSMPIAIHPGFHTLHTMTTYEDTQEAYEYTGKTICAGIVTAGAVTGGTFGFFRALALKSCGKKASITTSILQGSTAGTLISAALIPWVLALSKSRSIPCL